MKEFFAKLWCAMFCFSFICVGLQVWQIGSFVLVLTAGIVYLILT